MADSRTPETLLAGLPIAVSPGEHRGWAPPSLPIAGSAVAAADLRNLPTIAPAMKSQFAANLPVLNQSTGSRTAVASSAGDLTPGVANFAAGDYTSSSLSASFDPSAGGSNPTPTPAHITESVTDAAGDTTTLTIDYKPSADGSFEFDLKITWKFGTPPAAGATIADDSTNSNSSSGSFDLNIQAGPQSATITETEEASDSYNISDTLTASNAAGTWTDFGHDSTHLRSTFTLNADGTGSQTFSANSQSSAKYKLTETGDGFSYTVSGSDSTSEDESGQDASDGTGSGTLTANDTADEKITLNVTGGPVTGTATSTINVSNQDNGTSSPGASSDTVTTTRKGDDSVSVTVTDPTDGAYNDTEKYTDQFNISDTVTSGLGVATSESKTDSGGSTHEMNLSASNASDAGGSASETMKETNTTSYQNTKTIGSAAAGGSVETDENKTTSTWSSDTTETAPGDNYSQVGDSSITADFAMRTDPSGTTITKNDGSSSAPDTVTTGYPVDSQTLQRNVVMAERYANDFIRGGTRAMGVKSGLIAQSQIRLSDANGTSYSVSNAVDLKNALNTIRDKGLTIQELYIKGHGFVEGVQLTDGSNPDVLSCIQGTISLTNAAGGEDVTQLMDDVTGGDTYIMLAGCETGPFAQSLSAALGDGVRVQGNGFKYAIGIPFLPITIGWYWGGPYVNGQ